MASAYPTGTPSYAAHGATMDVAPLHNTVHVQHEEDIVAIATTMGLSPQGAFASIRARLDDMINNTVDIANLKVSELGSNMTPGGNTDATTSGTLTDWITVDTITVPTWAASAVCDFHVTGAHDFTSSSTYLLSGRIGGTTGAGTAIIAWGATGDRRAVSWTTVVTGMGTGAQTLKVAAQRLAGGGQARVDATSRMSAKVTFRP